MVDVWVPANRVERKLAWALAEGDLSRYLRLFATAELFQPLDGGDEDAAQGRELVQYRPDGTTVLPVFTSYEAMQAQVTEPVRAAAVTDFAHLRDTWPDPSWLLAIDPGLPIEAALPLPAVQRGLDGRLSLIDPAVTVRPLADDQWRPWPHTANHAVLEAVSLGDAAEYLDALLSSMVTVAVARPVGKDALLGVDFPWQPGGSAGAPEIEVFTDEGEFVAAYPDTPRTTLRFQTLLYDWPAGCALSVNPQRVAGMDLPAEAVPLILRWVREEARHGLDAHLPGPLLAGMRWARPGP
jgi:hypothetical protein